MSKAAIVNSVLSLGNSCSEILLALNGVATVP